MVCRGADVEPDAGYAEEGLGERGALSGGSGPCLLDAIMQNGKFGGREEVCPGEPRSLGTELRKGVWQPEGSE